MVCAGTSARLGIIGGAVSFVVDFQQARRPTPVNPHVERRRVVVGNAVAVGRAGVAGCGQLDPKPGRGLSDGQRGRQCRYFAVRVVVFHAADLVLAASAEEHVVPPAAADPVPALAARDGVVAAAAE